MKLDDGTKDIPHTEPALGIIWLSVPSDKQLAAIHRELDSLIGGEEPIPYSVVDYQGDYSLPGDSFTGIP